MKGLLRKLIIYLSYFGAAVVILLAVAVGLFRLMLPRLPEYQEEIKDWASAAIGLEVEFSGMNARWRLTGPELSFRDAALVRTDTSTQVLSANEVSVGVGFIRLLTDRELVVDRILIRDTSVDIRQDENGVWLLQDTPLSEVIGSRDMEADPEGEIVVVGQDIDVEYEHPGSGQVLEFHVDALEINRDDEQLAIDISIDLPEGFGGRLELSANQLLTELDDNVWRYFIEGDALDLAGWSRLQPIGMPAIETGSADLSLWLVHSSVGLQSATANVVVTNLAAAESTASAAFGMQGSIEFSAEPNGWLLAANGFRLRTVDADWPSSSLQIRWQGDATGELESLSASASYFSLGDLKYLEIWLPEEQQAMLEAYEPSGDLRNLEFDLSDVRSKIPRFSIAADLEAVGMAVQQTLPGVREFSGSIRADRAGGRLEIRSDGLILNLAQFLNEPIMFDDAVGTVIWRRSTDGITVLSDSVRIRNADLDSESSLQVMIPADGASPIVDLDSTWSVNDIGGMGRYLPAALIKPTLYQWLTDALVSGHIRRGTTRFIGPLDKFPFHGGEGIFRIDALLEDATLNYSNLWPNAQFRTLDLVVENVRLYSSKNWSTNRGNNVVDAQVEIPDLRDPVLSIEAFATGTLQSIQSFAAESPIAGVFGGQLGRIDVDGDASFNLSLSYPITDRENYEFTTRIRASDGTVRVQGFAPPVSELNGVVTVSRNEISSEALFGSFLGEPVDIDLFRAGDDAPGHSVVLTATGVATADAIVNDLGAPMAGNVEGAADYLTRILFPNGRADEPGVLQVIVESDLDGLGLGFPTPLTKSAETTMPLGLVIEFPAEGTIETSGSLSDALKWRLRFLSQNEAWDFDRGVLAVGGDYPAEPEIRGLHIVGQTPELGLEQWLSLARRGGEAPGLGERIRTIDLAIDRFNAVGQQFTDQRVEVNRSGLDWFIELRGAQAEGLVTVPYDFSGGRPLTLQMERLILPGAGDAATEADSRIDPRSLPSISIEAAQFALGDRYFGQLAIDLQLTAAGLEAENLATGDETFAINGRAGWVVDPSQPSGQRTFIDAELTSTDIEQTMRRLNYQPGIIGNDMQVNLDMHWDGSPRQDFLSSLSGSVSARLGVGTLEDVEPGAGRVFGLMSVVALPRRLSLDFSDVFDTGFGFDEITADFRLVNGEAYTCNLSLTGPAADVGVVGRAGLVARDYNQTAMISPNVGNTLPIVGAVVAGPQVAAALLIFSQVFKKPLQEMGQIYYAIEGSWDEPAIDVADSERFATSSSLAGCIEDAG